MHPLLTRTITSLAVLVIWRCPLSHLRGVKMLIDMTSACRCFWKSGAKVQLLRNMTEHKKVLSASYTHKFSLHMLD